MSQRRVPLLCWAVLILSPAFVQPTRIHSGAVDSRNVLNAAVFPTSVATSSKSSRSSQTAGNTAHAVLNTTQNRSAATTTPYPASTITVAISNATTSSASATTAATASTSFLPTTIAVTTVLDDALRTSTLGLDELDVFNDTANDTTPTALDTTEEAVGFLPVAIPEALRNGSDSDAARSIVGSTSVTAKHLHPPRRVPTTPTCPLSNQLRRPRPIYLSTCAEYSSESCCTQEEDMAVRSMLQFHFEPVYVFPTPIPLAIACPLVKALGVRKEKSGLQHALQDLLVVHARL